MISEQAQIHPDAKIASDVVIGPWTVLGPDVEIDSGTWIGPHVVIPEGTRIGKNNKIFQFASVGEAPQDQKYKGEKTYLEIGDNNIIREFCTINRGTVQDQGITRIGNENLFMAYVHVAHDCQIANHTIFSNNAALAGHVIVEDYVILGGYSGVHQFCKLGKHSFSSAGSVIIKDVPPFVRVAGTYAEPFGINIEGLRRRGFSAETIKGLRKAYKIIYRQGLTLQNAIEQLKTMVDECEEIEAVVDFLLGSTRGIVR